jgi:hypothetical protein
MIYLPSRCGSCGKVELVAALELQCGAHACIACGGELAPLAGCAYPEGDVALFTELSSLMRNSQIAGLEARRLAFALERGDLGGATDCLGWLAQRVPALEPTRRMLETYPGRQQQIITMLVTILHAMAEGRAVPMDQGGGRKPIKLRRQSSVASHGR